MPWKSGFICAILFSAFCFCQETKPDAQAHTTASISGTVIQADTHLPLKNVQITIAPNMAEASDTDADSSSDRQITAKTDEKGRFEISGLAPGSYSVQAAHAGMSLKGHSWQQGMLITLEAGKNQTLNLTMLPTGVISGQILNEDGEPMPHVSVAAMRYGYTIMGRHLAQAANASSDDKGQFRLFGLQPGSYLVLANAGEGAFESSAMVVAEASSSSASSKANAKVYTATYYPNEISAEHATPILLKPGEETRADFNLTRVPAHSVTGKVAGLAAPKSTDKDAPETQFSLVTAMRDGSSIPAGMAIIGKDSSFKFRSLPAGKYNLIAMHMGGNSGSVGSAEVVIDSSDVTGVVIGSESVRREITGVVRAEGDAKPDFSKLYVVFMPATDSDKDIDLDIASSFFGGSNGFAQVKSDGSFKVDLPPSAKPYNVVVSTRGTGLEDWFTSKVLAGGKDVLESGFKPGDARAAVEIVLSNKGALVEGTVLDRDQKPFANAEVIAFPRDPKLRRRMDMAQTATADQQGHFKMRGVRPGEYIVFALENSQEQPFTTELFMKNNSARTQTVKLEAAAKQDLQLQVISAQSQ
ncbi:MAG TPA: carboxypeptidase-like regulatory domain-containing protein [Candidatus Angelobacter sp.]|nr:carboxypeptidase-like regulatory domain-containing protein [Candidatus Angelobacter sp.]